MTATTIRYPAVAGRFYPAYPQVLRSEVRAYLSSTPGAEVSSRAAVRKKPIRALGCIAPHAGYMYSAHVAGAVFAELAVPELCIVMCPNHTGMG